MTSELLQELVYVLAFLSVFLLLGTFLRAKVKIFQKAFLPASVIGGFLALILGPIGLNLISIPEGWIKTFSLLPGILIVPIVAAVPLGLRFKGGSGKSMINIAPAFFIMGLIGALQITAGFLTNVVYEKMGTETYPAFGWELLNGFSGGHGTAGLVGNVFKSMNLPYWETAQGVTVTTATIGILGGIIIGMILINWAARTGGTQMLKDPSQIPESIRVGYEKDVTKQGSVGRETTMSSSIDTFAFHFAIIMTACGISYLILNNLKKFKVPVLSDISIWAYAILVMFAIWGLMVKFKIDYLVDSKVKSKITGSFTEIAVVAAIASLPVDAVMAYIVPIVVMSIFGFIVTVIPVVFCTKKYIKGYWFEHGIAILGMNTGVFLTGLLLLRIVDPEFKSPALGNYTLGYTIATVLNFALLQVYIGVIITKGPIGMIMLGLGMVAIYIIALIVFDKFNVNIPDEV